MLIAFNTIRVDVGSDEGSQLAGMSSCPYEFREQLKGWPGMTQP